MNADDEDVLLFLVENYVMIDGKYFRDLPIEMKDSLLLEAHKGVLSLEAGRHFALKNILKKYGSFRGQPFSQQTPEALDKFIAGGRDRLDKFLAKQDAELARQAEYDRQAQRQLQRQKDMLVWEKDAPYRHGVTEFGYSREAAEMLRKERALMTDRASSLNGIQTDTGEPLESLLPKLLEIAKPNMRFNPYFVSTELRISKNNADLLLKEMVDVGYLKRLIDDWHERL